MIFDQEYADPSRRCQLRFSLVAGTEPVNTFLTAAIRRMLKVRGAMCHTQLSCRVVTPEDTQ
jgi:hypothetical protein